jgi:hypothetical protein
MGTDGRVGGLDYLLRRTDIDIAYRRLNKPKAGG